MNVFTPSDLWSSAGPIDQLVIVALCVAIVAAVLIPARALSERTRTGGSSHFLSALQVGGPLLGLFGGAYNLMITFGAAAAVSSADLRFLAPYLALAAALVALGAFAGVVATLARWKLDSSRPHSRSAA